MKLDVACYAGHRGEETPRRITLGGRAVEVVEVLDCWHGPDHRYFKVTGSTGKTYVLRQDVRSARWELT